jgi:predicted alpha/beta-fold hydrolase
MAVPHAGRARCCSNAAILSRCGALRSRYWPSPFLLQADASIAFYLLKERVRCCFRPPAYEREELQMADGGLIALDWINRPVAAAAGVPPPPLPPPPVLLILPGVTASSNDMAAASLAAAAGARGWRAAVLMRRGHGGLPLKTLRFNVFGDTSDTDAAVR